jgi:hypothetical protein
METKPMEKPKRVRTTLNLPEDLWKAAKIRAIELGMDAQDLVALVLEQYLNRRNRQAGTPVTLYVDDEPKNANWVREVRKKRLEKERAGLKKGGAK